MRTLFKSFVTKILTWEAQAVLTRRKPRVVAVTGSVGKTATKDAIFAALSTKLHVRKSDKSLNSELGVPLAILGLESGWNNPFVWVKNIIEGLYVAFSGSRYPEWVVLEIGADRPGDIRSIARWVRPDIAVLTHVPEVPVHVEFFSSPEEVAREKRSLVEHLRPGGTLVVNGDDLRLSSGLEMFAGTRVTYGIEGFNDFSGANIWIDYEDALPVGMKFRLDHAGSTMPIRVRGVLGVPCVYAALAALAVAHVAGVDLAAAAESLSKWDSPPGRMRILRGNKNSTIIDDTYNSSPAAAMAALDTLNEIKANRKIAVLGDMLELGKYSTDAHKKAGAKAAESADILMTVGIRSRAMGEAALDAGMKDRDVFEYEMGESRRAGAELDEMLKEGDVVLVKGSQAMRMERTVEEIMAEPERKAALLVRQDPEWLAKP